MKRLFGFLISLFCFSNLYAQDVIVKQDGNTILAKVLEISKTTIKYKKHNNQKGPTYSIGTDEVSRINYENGECDDFSNIVNSPNSGYTPAIALADNKDIIAKFNIDCMLTNVKEKKKATKYVIGVYGVSEESIINTQLMSINIIPDIYCTYSDGLVPDHIWRYTYITELINKTDKIIWIDLGNSFLLSEDNTYISYYDPTQIANTTGHNSGIGLNLGSVASVLGVGGIAGTLASGVNVGGGTSSSKTKIKTQQRIISIPPHGKIDVGDDVIPELHCSKMCKEKGISVNIGETISYTLDNTPFYREHIICFSDTPDFSTYSTLSFKIYLRQIFGCDLCFDYTKNRFKKEGANRYKMDILQKHLQGADTNTIISIPRQGYWDDVKRSLASTPTVYKPDNP